MSLNYRLELNKDTKNLSPLQVGGIVPMFFDIFNIDGLLEVTEMLNYFKIPYYVVGGCTKLLFPDEFPQVALIHICMNMIVELDEYVEVEAGVKLTKLAMNMSKKGYEGFAGLISIPGEVGGSILNNAGAFGDEIGKNLVYLDVFEDGMIKRLTMEDIWFSYRACSLKYRKAIIIKAGFKKVKGDAAALLKKQKENHKLRLETQPTGVKTLGSTYKNIPGIHVAKIIDELGLKGFRLNDVSVSRKHANFLINERQATQKNILNIIDILNNKLYNKLGIIPELEIIILRW